MRDPLREPRVGDVVKCWDDEGPWQVLAVLAVGDEIRVMYVAGAHIVGTEVMDLDTWRDWSMWENFAVLHAADDTMTDTEHDAAAMAESWASDKAMEDYDKAYISGWADACRDVAAAIRRREHRGAWMRGGA